MVEFNVEERARLSAGESAAVIHDAVLAALTERGIRAHSLLDVGCGTGSLRAIVQSRCERYIGADALRHDGFPADAEFVLANLDAGRVALPDGTSDVVACIETIEHVENPRALMRELVRLTRPGGLLVVTTPNQLSVLSKLALLTKNEFVHFQERPGLYPAHISALLEVDLVRMCRENGLEDVAVRYSGQGRIPFTARDWPAPFRAGSGRKGRAFSDNVLVVARKPLTTTPAASTS
ncbi:MAG TPA: methyltransferase domain-containing protein [Polyangiaceae bacterium]|nr:methyltransferase domain-containing protein [Polyangiaceae bacterium]